MTAVIEDRIREEARKLGFVACGFAPASLAESVGGDLRQWLDEGRQGTMRWIEGRWEQRSSPDALWPEARSAIALAMSYAPETDPRAPAEPGTGRVSVYARGGDYHKTVKKALKALARWLDDEAGGELKVFVDTSPVMEKPLAQAAGIGWQRRREIDPFAAHVDDLGVRA